MTLLSGTNLRDAIARVVGGSTVSCAVAFWGRGAVDLIGPPQGRTIKLVCNLKMGGTNPDVIEALMRTGVIVQQSDRLHAKVYIGDDRAVVTSANASINGLGLEGNELAGWMEAGVEMSAQEAQPWFDGIWRESRTISREDIATARRIFRERAHMKPTRGSFAEFDPTTDDFPFVEWVGNHVSTHNDRAIIAALGVVNDTVHERIDNGLDIEAPGDVQLFRRGRWVLRWKRNANGAPHQATRPWWTCSSGQYIPNAFTYVGEAPQGSVLAMHPMPPVPFDTSEQRFRQSFYDVMNRDSFAALRERDYDGSFFTDERRDLMWQFWADLKAQYTKTAPS